MRCRDMTCECSLCHKRYENKADGAGGAGGAGGAAMHYANQVIWTCPACRKAGRIHSREDVKKKINRYMQFGQYMEQDD